VHEALKTFGEVYDLTFTTGDKDAQIKSATAAGDVKLSEAQATTAAKAAVAIHCDAHNEMPKDRRNTSDSM